MSCNDCLFIENLSNARVAIPCNSCQGDSSDKGYCVASYSNIGYTPIVTRIFDLKHACNLIHRARESGSDLELLQWSQEKNAFRPANVQSAERCNTGRMEM